MNRANLISMGFIAAGLSNLIGVSVATAGFSNPLVAAEFPEVFSDFGMVAIMLWGMAYIAVSQSYAAVPWLVAVFALEKACYVASWIYWFSGDTSTVAALWDQSVVTGLFYAVYGANDLFWGLFFAWVSFLGFRSNRP